MWYVVTDRDPIPHASPPPQGPQRPEPPATGSPTYAVVAYTKETPSPAAPAPEDTPREGQNAQVGSMLPTTYHTREVHAGLFMLCVFKDLSQVSAFVF